MAVLSAIEYRKIQDKKPEIVSRPEQVAESIEKPRVKRPKADDPWFILQHPDATPGNMVTCDFELEIDGQKEKVKIERGRVETQVKGVKDELIRRGYLFMNEEF